MDKRLFTLFLLLLGVLCPFSGSYAQSPADRLETMRLSFWPDFDQPSVLVLMTGALPAETALPAEVTIPVPADARVNAVASIDDSGMVSIDYESSGETLTFVATQPQFRVEYYAPYEQDGPTRSYDFLWESAMSVAQMEAEIQQPANAISLSSDPEVQNVATDQVDGLVYHRFDPVPVPAGTPYQLSFSYEMASEGLTSAAAVAQPETTGPPAASAEAADTNDWLLYAGVAGLIALAIAGTWLVATRASRKPNRPRKPRPNNKATEKTAPTAAVGVYCHVCGQAAESDDRFCRRCGAELKRL